MTTDLPPGPYGAILADPPWRYDVWNQLDDFIAADGRRRGPKCPARHYDVRESDWIKGLDVAGSAAPDAALFLWVLCPLLSQGLSVLSAWGFEYRTVAFSWMKVKKDGLPLMGLGNWTRANVELCLLGTRGHPKRLHADVRQAILERRREHSRKPDCVRERIQRLVAGPYLELFARSSAPGWDCWGNEVGKFDADSAPLVPTMSDGRLFAPEEARR